MPRLILVNYAGAEDPALNNRLLAAQAAQHASAPNAGIHTVISWNRDKLKATPFYEENREILDRPRGGGYWLWKPYIILDALQNSDPDDVILYYDVGRASSFTFIGSVHSLVQWCREHSGLLPGAPLGPQSIWTKRDCFHYMDCDAPQFWRAQQILTTFSLWSGARAIKLVSEWLHWRRDRRCLTDDPNQCALPNYPGFREHRHDQSVLTNLCIKRGIVPLPAPLVPRLLSKDINRWASALVPQPVLGSPEELGGWIGIS